MLFFRKVARLSEVSNRSHHHGAHRTPPMARGNPGQGKWGTRSRFPLKSDCVARSPARRRPYFINSSKSSLTKIRIVCARLDSALSSGCTCISPLWAACGCSGVGGPMGIPAPHNFFKNNKLETRLTLTHSSVHAATGPGATSCAGDTLATSWSQKCRRRSTEGSHGESDSCISGMFPALHCRSTHRGEPVKELCSRPKNYALD